MVEFRFYNKYVDEDVINEFHNEVKREFHDRIFDEELLKESESLKILKQIYKKFSGGINDTSLCLSIVSQNGDKSYDNIAKKCFFCNAFFDVKLCDDCSQVFGYIFTGDINLSKNKTYDDFINYYNYLPDKIKVFTVPHHGSIVNWNANLISEFPEAHWVITARDSKKHPSPEVIKDILKSSCNSTLVSDNQNKKFYNEVFYKVKE